MTEKAKEEEEVTNDYCLVGCTVFSLSLLFLFFLFSTTSISLILLISLIMIIDCKRNIDTHTVFLLSFLCHSLVCFCNLRSNIRGLATILQETITTPPNYATTPPSLSLIYIVFVIFIPFQQHKKALHHFQKKNIVTPPNYATTPPSLL